MVKQKLTQANDINHNISECLGKGLKMVLSTTSIENKRITPE